MEPKQITSLANLLRDNGDKILTSEFKLTLSGSLLRALNDSFTLIADQSELCAPLQFQVVKPNTSKSDVFRDLQLIHDFVQKTIQLCIKYMSCNGNGISISGSDVDDDYFEGLIDITKFRNLRILEIQKVNIKQIIGIQPLRAQLNKLICQRCLTSIDDIITYCGGDNSNGFVWNELKSADFSYNNLMKVDKSLEFVQYLQILDLSHNKLISCEAIKWLPNLKILNLSYNRLNMIPSFHLEASRRLQILLINNNYIENLNGIQRLDALTELDLSDNFLLEHTKLLPLNTLVTLKYLNLYGNTLYCHPEHRINTACYLNKNAESVKFVLDTKTLTKHEKTFIGKYLMYQQHSIQTSTTRSILSPLKYERSSITNEQMINTTTTTTTSTTESQNRNAYQNQMTASSSVGSTKSYGGLNESMTTITVTETTEPSNINNDMTTSLLSIKNDKSSTKKLRRRRTVDLEQPQQQYNTTNNFSSSSSSVISPNSQSKLSSLSTAALNNITSDATVSNLDSSQFMKKSKNNDKLLMTTSTDHLETKKQIEDIRKRFGDSWLHGDNSHMIKSVIGLNDNDNDKYFKLTSKQLIDDFLGESIITNQQDLSKNLKKNDKENDKELLSSSNKNKDYDDDHIQNKDKIDEMNTTDNSLYKSVTSTDDNNTTSNSSILYNSAIEDGQSILNDIYSSVNDEPEISEPEDNENTYIVYGTDKNDELLLTVSDISIKERDVLTRRTKTKWSLKILESCDRIKANTLRINFDTIKKDKRERVYTVEEGLCQELENYLRDILSKRLLSEMNQTVYRCVNCACQFSRENTYNKNKNSDIFCPECKSAYVVEVHETTSKSSGISVSLEQQKDLKFHSTTTAVMTSTSTAMTVVAKTPPKNNTSSISTTTISDALKAVQTSSSISKTIAAVAAEVATNLHKQQHGINENSGSAGSLNESSSCSKISNSQSSFDSNQSVAGSSTNERDLDLLNYFKNKNNCESDVEILSNPSQSSIEVLDSGIGGLITNYPNNNNNGGGGAGAGNGNRKISEERKFLQIPSLETIEDRNVNISDGDGGSNYDGDVDDDDNDNGIKIWDYNLQKLMIKNTDKNEKDNSTISKVKTDDKNEISAVENLKKTTETSSINDLSGGKKNLLSNVNLTESSSSGSITDSICTAYEQQQNDKILDTVSTSTLTGSSGGGGGAGTAGETIASCDNNSGSNKTIIIDKDNNKKDESIITSMLGGLFQTTNLLMSSSKSQKSLSSNTNLDSNIKKSSSSSSLSSSSATKTILEKFKFNYEDFGDIDHRLKLYFYQMKFDDANEHFKWLVKGKILNELNMELINGIIVMSTTKLYIMEIIEINNQKYNNYDNDNITKWLKQIINIKLERLEQIQLLPWHIGLSFKIRNYGTFLLILQDILRTDSLLLYFANNPLPSNCILEYQISDKLMKKLSICVDSEQLKMFSLLNKCEIIKNLDINNKNNDNNVNIMKNDKIILPSCCCLLITDTHLYITKSNLSWLSLNLNTKIDIYMKQLMSNLIEIKRNNINSKNIFINFLDETNQKNDTKWICEFETIENTDSCLNAIGQSWEKLFGVPLIFSSNNDDDNNDDNVCDQKNTT